MRALSADMSLAADTAFCTDAKPAKAAVSPPTWPMRALSSDCALAPELPRRSRLVPTLLISVDASYTGIYQFFSRVVSAQAK